ncbi:MAG: ABC transporter substrate-binding protein, partial [Promicromonosporaceae bacterium]|nr:ABC transporter substrate-binding protein [Promicromonosporaceae bacterium]
ETNGGDEDPITEFPRNETLFSMGTMWAPPTSWNPIPFTGGATGTLGLIYETLFNFNLDTLELVPWLAESGSWVDDNTYVLVLRDGITWHDGEPLTTDDVVFSFEMGKVEGVSWGIDMWTMLEEITVDGNAITFVHADPRPQQWDNILYTRGIMPKHIMGDWSGNELMTLANDNPVGSGPFKYLSHGQDRQTFQRNDNWWGIEHLGMTFEMRFIVDLVNTSNEVALNLLQQGQLDISNNFLPGINQLVAQDIVGTYFDGAPFMLSANTAVLVPNHEREPMSDVNFRRALAYSINVDLIVASAFGDLVQSASPTGLFPVFDTFVNRDLVAQYGFTYDVERAREILTEAGYVEADNGYFAFPDGSTMEVELIVPAGWTDWMDAAQLIQESASEAGIFINVNHPDAGNLDDRRTIGDFDLVINNWSQVSNTPWTWWGYVFSYPLGESMWANFGRFPAAEAWTHVQALGRSTQGTPAFNEHSDALQTIMLQELPMIPMWYNGLWAQWTEGVWTGWPSGGQGAGWPSTWHGYWQLGMIDVLAALTLAN